MLISRSFIRYYLSGRQINQQCRTRVGICLNVSTKEEVADALADRISKELSRAGLEALKTDKPEDDNYTVIINDQTMEDGILHLKHVNPRVTEEVHVTSLEDRLTKLNRASLLTGK